jgi:hypothetical protein
MRSFNLYVLILKLDYQSKFFVKGNFPFISEHYKNSKTWKILIKFYITCRRWRYLNLDILETGLINILALVGILVYTGRDF